MKRTPENIDNIKVLIQRFFEGQIDALQVIESWPNAEKVMTNQEANLIHELRHYFSDEDIRLKDHQYEQMQIDNIKKMYASLISK